MLRPNAQPRALSYAKNRMQKGRIPSISAVGNMDPLGLSMQQPFGSMGTPFGAMGMQAYGLTAPGMMPPPIPGVPGQIPPFDRTPR